jgi:2'-5' RNA ligase
MAENKTCVWIGIGANIPETSRLGEAIGAAHALLRKKYDSRPGFSGSSRSHLNLYDLSVPRQNLKAVVETVKMIAAAQKSFTLRTGEVDYFPFGLFFVETLKNSKLIVLHKKLVAQVSALKGDCIDPDYLEPRRKYSVEQKRILMRYGNPHVLDFFHPHITIGQVNSGNLKSIKKELNGLFGEEKLIMDHLRITIENKAGKKVTKRFHFAGK